MVAGGGGGGGEVCKILQLYRDKSPSNLKFNNFTCMLLFLALTVSMDYHWPVSKFGSIMNFLL